MTNQLTKRPVILIKDHFWVVAGDDKNWFSTAARDYVSPQSDAALAFTQRGGLPSRVTSETELWTYLIKHDTTLLPDSQKHMAPVPSWKFHAVLKIEGLEGDLEAALLSLPQPSQSVARARLEYSETYDRSDPLVDQLGLAIGKSPIEMDALWRMAHQL